MNVEPCETEGASHLSGNGGFRDSTAWQRGFSLIELSVVLILIGVVVMVTFPKLAGLFSGRRLKGFCRELAGTLDYTRSRAVIEGRPQTFYIDGERKEYWVGRPEEASGDFGGSEEDAVIRKWKIPEGISVKRLELGTRVVDRYTPVIRFYPRGNSNGADIFLETDQGDRAVIKVKPYTGRSQVVVEK
ncbi:MAG: GspH/FimT family protein [PVC group bacterium]